MTDDEAKTEEQIERLRKSTDQNIQSLRALMAEYGLDPDDPENESILDGFLKKKEEAQKNGDKENP